MCKCIDRIDELLKPHNTKLALTLTFGGSGNVFPTIMTEQVEKGRGKPKARAMLPSFCCFCGESYKATTVAAPAPESGNAANGNPKSQRIEQSSRNDGEKS